MKFSFFFASILVLFCSCQQGIVTNGKLDIDNLNYGWSSDYDSIAHHISINDPWGARGWVFGLENDSNTYFDASEYDNVVINLENIKGVVDKLHIIVKYTDNNIVSRSLPTIVNGSTTMRIDLDSIAKSQVKSVFIICENPCEMDIINAYFGHAHHYGPAKKLEMSPIGIISSDQFDGYSDNALVEMTFESKGEMVSITENGDTIDMAGWSVGIICSAADILGAELPTRGIIIENTGIQKYKCLFGDIKYLISLKDDDGECGIYWTVMKVGNLEDIHVVETTIAEAID